jgi:hypothetical protein
MPLLHRHSRPPLYNRKTREREFEKKCTGRTNKA